MRTKPHKSITHPVRLVVSGLGNIGRRFLEILERKADHLRTRYGLTFQVIGAADSRGAAFDPDGLDLATVIQLKAGKRSVAEYPGNTGRGAALRGAPRRSTAPRARARRLVRGEPSGEPSVRAHGGYPKMSPLELLAELGRAQIDVDALCEATPVNLQTGEPGLGCMRAAMKGGMHVVTANKGPLVLAYPELTALAREKGVRLLFCGTVAGGLPAINLGRRDLAGAIIHRLDAVPNLTTSLILDRMSRGQTYEEALAVAQAQGYAEADPSLDVDGWDAANKLVILASSVLNVPATLDDVHVQGITGITLADLERAKARGAVIKLVASAVRQADKPPQTGKPPLTGGHYTLTVTPTPLPADHPLAQLGGQQMGIVYHTDIYGTISASIRETEPIPSAATMLRDLLSIYAAD